MTRKAKTDDPMAPVRVLLDMPHTHRGVVHEAGALLIVPRHEADSIARCRAGHVVEDAVSDETTEAADSVRGDPRGRSPEGV